jgi:hypothetical protein
MPIINKKVNGFRYPTIDAEIDYGNEISKGLSFAVLFNQPNTLPVDLVRRIKAGGFVTSNYATKRAIGGRTIDWQNNGSIWYPRGPSFEKLPWNMSWAAFLRRGGTLNSNATPFGKSWNNAGGSPFLSYAFTYNAGGAGQNFARADLAEHLTSLTSTSSVNIGETTIPHIIAATADGDTLTLYNNGLKKTDLAYTGPITFDTSNTTGNFIISGLSNASVVNPWNGDIYWVLIWQRTLSQNELRELYKDPYQLFKPIKRRFIFPVAQAGGGGTSATATPSLQTITAKLFSANVSILVSRSQTTTPALLTATAKLFTPTVSFSKSESRITTPALLTATAKLFTPNAVITKSESRTTTPSLLTVTAKIFNPTVVFGNSFSRTTTPALLTATAKLFTPTVAISNSRTVTPSMISASIITFSPTQKFTQSQVTTPGLTKSSFIIFGARANVTTGVIASPGLLKTSIVTFNPTVKITASRIAQPGLTTSRITTLGATAILPGSVSGITNYAVYKSQIEKYLYNGSLIENKVTKKSQIEKVVLSESELN